MSPASQSLTSLENAEAPETKESPKKDSKDPKDEHAEHIRRSVGWMRCLLCTYVMFKTSGVIGSVVSMIIVVVARCYCYHSF